MAATNRKKLRRLAAALMTGASICVVGVVATPSHAQNLLQPAADSDAKMLLRANELVYNQDTQRVTATGAVQIYYNRYNPEVSTDERIVLTMAVGIGVAFVLAVINKLLKLGLLSKIAERVTFRITSPGCSISGSGLRATRTRHGPS